MRSFEWFQRIFPFFHAKSWEKTVKRSIQDSLRFWIPDTGFQSLSVELGFWIPIVSWILDSLNCSPDSKAQDSWFHKQEFLTFRNPDFLTRGNLDNLRLLLQAIVFIYRSILRSFLFKQKYFDPQAGMRVVRNWIKPNKSGFHVMTEWVFYNSILILVFWKHLQTKENNITESKK